MAHEYIIRHGLKDSTLVHQENLNINSSIGLTISSDAVTRSKLFHEILGENSSDDNLSTINGGSEGDLLYITPSSENSEITIKNNVGNIKTSTGLDYTLSYDEIVILYYDGTIWKCLLSTEGEWETLDELPLIYSPVNYSPYNGRLDKHFTGIDEKIGELREDVDSMETLITYSPDNYSSSGNTSDDHFEGVDDALAIPSSPTNYTPSETTINGHFEGIDTKLGSISVEKIYKTYTLASHGFVAKDILKVSGSGTFEKAKADSKDNSQSVGIVESVDGDDFIVVFNGLITVSGLIANTLYYLDPDTAGALTSTEPDTDDNEVIKPILVALSTTQAIILNQLSTTINEDYLNSLEESKLDDVEVEYSPNYYTKTSSTLGGHLEGLDNKVNDIETTATNSKLSKTSTKTSNYNAGINEVIPVDAASNNITVYLPYGTKIDTLSTITLTSGTAGKNASYMFFNDKGVIHIKRMDDSSNTITVQCLSGGSSDDDWLII